MLQIDDALGWQIGVWDRISQLYLDEVDQRFVPVVARCVELARLKPGEEVLDLGTGTGAVALRAAREVAPGRVLGVDISPQMLGLAEGRVRAAGLDNVTLIEGRAESIPADDSSVDVLLACLSLMYVIDREQAALECARVLRPGGRLVAAVWATADEADIVRFQQGAGAFAAPPPVAGVGPGALGDPTVFLDQLRDAGITAEVQTEPFTFSFGSFDHAWEVLAGVTTAQLPPERQEEARRAVQALMWNDLTTARTFRNATHLISGTLDGDAP